MKRFLFLVILFVAVGCSDDANNENNTNNQNANNQPQPLCSNSCEFADDDACDDGGPGSEFDDCAYGTDCSDCGPRPAGGNANNANANNANNANNVNNQNNQNNGASGTLRATNDSSSATIREIFAGSCGSGDGELFLEFNGSLRPGDSTDISVPPGCYDAKATDGFLGDREHAQFDIQVSDGGTATVSFFLD